MKRAVCTIVTKSFLAQARVMAQSVKKNNPDLEVIVLFSDLVGDSFDPGREPFTTLQLHELPEQEAVQNMAFYYSAYEYCCALRPILHQYLMQQGYDRWIFLDADMMVFSSLDPAFQELEHHDILLTLHFNSLSQDDSIVETWEKKALATGVFNAGFHAFKNSPQTSAFLEWWKSRLKRHAFYKPFKGSFLDQYWLTFTPHYFNKTGTFLHPGMNVAYWNLHERRLAFCESRGFLSNDQPLMVFHFSGWEIDKSENLSKLAPHYDNYPNEVWKKIAALYKQSLVENGYEETKKLPYAFSKFKSGQEILPQMRTHYFHLLMNGQWPGGSPFEKYDLFKQLAPKPAGVIDFLKRVHRLAYRVKKALLEGVRDF